VQIWLFNPPTDRARIEALEQIGVDTVVAGEQALDPLLETPLKTYAVAHAFPATGESEDLTIDIYGQPFQWFGSGCPNSPAIRTQFYRTMDRLLKGNIKGVFLDGVRFPSPASSETNSGFFSCFCPRCQEDMTTRGYDRETIMRDVRQTADLILTGLSTTLQRWLRDLCSPAGWLTLNAAYPGLFAWFKYRADCITDFVQELSTWMCKSHTGKELAAFLFQPCLAYFVGQDYRRLSPDLQIVSPMIYRNYPHRPGPATINQEIMAMATLLWEGTSLSFAQCLQDLLHIFGLEVEEELPQNPDSLISMPIAHVTAETLAAAAFSGPRSKVIPIIWAGDHRLPETIAALKQTGVEQAILFTYEAGVAAHKGQFHEILADRLRR
jgi:hypothetical protein